jgi:phospholipid N-methyltransferase
MDFSRARVCVEVGAGTGAITREILNSLRGDAKLIVFEVNKDFCEQLRAANDSRLIVHNVSAYEMDTILAEKADYVVSGIPLAVLSKPEFARLYSAVRAVLDPGGVFIQVQLAPVSYGRLRRCFRDVKVGFTWRNTPPAFLYHCRGPARSAEDTTRKRKHRKLRNAASSNRSIGGHSKRFEILRSVFALLSPSGRGCNIK